ncbi:unnamed protein product [Porites lobata]|uniref:Uncharacterized protein n=1 Tax=Porites lobata TaxID=104759 RepID=A0ABN8NQ30_9CNID|nr:unnamed protein product [Porites lobata]
MEVNSAGNAWKDIFLNIVDKPSPTRVMRVRNKPAPWLNSKLKEEMDLSVKGACQMAGRATSSFFMRLATLRADGVRIFFSGRLNNIVSEFMETPTNVK